ncbi:MAG: 8-hydroxy-5-deazaflavin:NADPH oxidoreductase, partial [Cryptosporangiaceae bacterium]|nr:8-hydroxy-5-deazaflavin:NADPH oxidoreductase [Cryptosporangiaceae bacterium]
MTDVSELVVGVHGRTGPHGRGLAIRLAAAGQRVLLGSRDAARAASVAAELTRESLASGSITGDGNAVVAASADVVIVAVPWDGHADLLKSLAGELAGKIVVDCVNPLGFDSQGAYALAVPEGSAAQQAATLLPESRVTAAFHHVSAVLLVDPQVTSIDTDVMVLGDDREATNVVADL